MPSIKFAPNFSRFSVLASIGTISLLALVGCGAGSSTDPSSSAQEQTSSHDQSSSSDRTPNESSASSTSSDAAPVETGKAGALTQPGTKLKIGEPANTHANTGKDPQDAKYKEATYTTTVTKIVTGSPADLAQFKDSSKYAGQTPYYVYAESKLTSLSKPTAGLSAPSLKAQLKDGSDAQKLIVFGGFDKCKSTSFKTTGKGESLSYQVGSSAVSCTVFLAPKGDEVSSVSYSDPRFSYANYSDNKYRDNPIIWSK